MSKKNYLNKKDLLLEIIRSKNTYSEFLDSSYELYDVIINSRDEITPELLKEAKEKKIENIYAQERADVRERNGTSAELSAVKRKDISEIKDEDIVFRFMTFEHIPEDLNRVNKKKTVADNHVKVNFPPFKHLIYTNGEIKEVGRSHWTGGFSNGYFCLDHGNLTVKLCSMMKLLVEKYSQKGNFRGYCVDKDTEALTNRGWLRYDQITEQDMILSMNLDNCGFYEWSKIYSIFRGEYDTTTNPKMFHLTNQDNTFDAFVTPKHKFVVQTKQGLQLKKVDDLANSDQLIFASRINIFGNSKNVTSPTNILKEFLGTMNDISFGWTNSKVVDSFKKINLLSCDEKIYLREKAEEFIKNTVNINQETIDWISYLLCLYGFNTIQTEQNLRIVRNQGENILNGTKKLKSRLNPFSNKGTEDYKDIVWCPVTEFGNFVSRRNGVVSVTGNTYNDEMRSRAIIQLLTVGLQFNEAKSDNPFAYYTRIAQHAFIGVLNSEKKAQTIRDDILIKMGVTPSFSRQVEYEMEYKQKEFNERHNIQESNVVLLKAPTRGGRKKGS